MIMVELTSVPAAALPVAALSDHLRLSSGFADDGSQDAMLEGCLRAAMAAIEARIGKALVQRQFVLTLTEWQSGDAHALPIAPVVSVESVKLISRGGQETLVDRARYGLRKDTHRPMVVASSTLPVPASGGAIEVLLTAGYGADWAAVPADLQQAMLGLAADFYNLDATAPRQLSGQVLALIEPYRQIRLRGGAA